MMLPLSLMMKLREMSSMVKWDRNGENILLKISLKLGNYLM